MAVGVHDSVVRVADSEALAAALAVDVVLGTAVDGEVRRLVHKGSSLGISAGGWCTPEGTAEVDDTGAIRRVSE